MASQRNSEFLPKDLRALKKDQLIRIIQESQNKAYSPDLERRSEKKVETDAVKSSNKSPKSSMLPGNEAGSTGWLLAQIKVSVVEAVQELKSELRQEYKALLKDLDDKLSTKINEVQSEVNALKYHVDSSIENFEKPFLNDLRETEHRKNNVMIFGLKENNASSPSDCSDDDRDRITCLSSELGVSDLKIAGCFRLGRRSSRPRPIKVTCHSSEQRSALLRTAYKIPKLDERLGFRRIFVKPDLSPREQEIDRRLRLELKRRRDWDERVVIRNGRVVELNNDTKHT